MHKDHLALLVWYAEQGFTHTLKTHEDPDQKKEQALEVAESILSLEAKSKGLADLKEEILHFEGCSLKQGAQNTVFGEGDINARLMLVGEAPGAQEDQQGRPFVGLSGQLLDAMLLSIGLKRHEVYISNMIPWRPPFNRQPTGQELDVCRPFIERHIGLIAPDILVCVGSTAFKGLLGLSTSITQAQAQSFTYMNTYLSQPIAAYALFHPSYLLRAPGQKKLAWHQLLYIKKALKVDF